MTLTPMMRQYHDAKASCGDALLLFRMGDFYELFEEDAKTAARVLGLTLTSRDKGENGVPMAGFPYHQLESYLRKVIAAGMRAAVCEQVEDPKLAKGLVKREVTRIVTPGTVTDDALLDPRESNYLAAIVGGDSKRGEKERRRKGEGRTRSGGDEEKLVGLAWIDLSTGKFQAAAFPRLRLADELARIQPAECLLADGAADLNGELDSEVMVTRRPDWSFSLKSATDALTRQFGTASLEGFGFGEEDGPAIAAAGAILDYLFETQKTGLGHVEALIAYRRGHCLEIDESTRRSLEITRTMREGRREGSLLFVLDKAVTGMGSRLLADWLASPLTSAAAIEQRYDAVAELLADSALCDSLRGKLKEIYDVQRLLARVTTGRATPRDLNFVGRTLRNLPPIKAKLSARTSRLLNRLEAELDLCPEVRGKLEAALVDDCPLLSREGGFIRPGFDAELDALRELTRGGKQWIASYQRQEIERSGISNLKVGFNKVFGYYLEITNAHRDKVPDGYIRKQTLKNAERYITPELKEYEEQVLEADEKSKELEYELFLELRDLVAASARRLQASADVLAELDVLAALATLARQRGYCRPKLVEEPLLDIIDGRHPVLDAVMPEGTFVPNDVKAGSEEGQILLVTGPNMSGKSTYIRQTALLVLMAQTGSFIPAASATIGIADAIFARVGASDELTRGQSTFMVEMTESARILNTATPNSLVILDELGRGTSTYDGLSLAWSVVEYLHEHIGCRTLFATHYHELTDLARSLKGVKNFNVAVREWEDEVVFLHKILPGAADKSYGIHVARLAGVPREVIERAKTILCRLESEHVDSHGRAKIARQEEKSLSSELQLSLFGAEEHPLLEKLRQLDLNGLTPLEALNRIKGWQDELRSDKLS